ncbi:MAG: hypothetical protein LBF15_00855 [Candidatus Peribacteria bacterium]|jgi:hypothetical protein|nr:hypothetical protein [Candidatus Peribacteria bacterium]
MKKFLLSIFTIILLSSCSLFQKEEVIPTIQDIPNQIEEQTITEIPTPIDNIVENKIEITEKQKTRNLSIKEQILNIFKEKEEKLTLFPKNWTTETQTEIIPE